MTPNTICLARHVGLCRKKRNGWIKSTTRRKNSQDEYDHPAADPLQVNKNAAYPKAVETLKTNQQRPLDCELRQVKYLNHLIEQDHRFLKRLNRPGLGFFSFETAQRTLLGYETMNMIRKGQMKGAEKGDILAQVHLINGLFGIPT